MSVQAYIARQAASLGRRLASAAAWVPTGLAEAQGPCLGVLRSDFKGVDRASSLALSRDGRQLFTSSPDGFTRCWDLASGQVRWQVHQSGGERHSHTDITLAPNGLSLASAYCDKGLVLILDPETGQHQATLTITGPWKTTWSPDHRFLAVSSRCSWRSSPPDMVVVFELGSWRPIKTLAQPKAWGLAWSPDGSLLAAVAADDFCLYNTQTWQTTITLKKPFQGMPIAWSTDGSLLAYGGDRGQITLYQGPDWQVFANLKEGNTTAVLDIAFSADQSLLASGHGDGTTLVHSLDEKKLLARFSREEKGGAYDYSAWRLAWHPSGSFLAVSYRDGTFRLWDARSLMAAPAPGTGGGSVAVALAYLPQAMGALAGLGIFAAAGLVRDLLILLAGGRPPSALAALARHPGVLALAALGWPQAARVGLAALLLRDVAAPQWQPPPQLTPQLLVQGLQRALNGEAVAASCDTVPLGALARAAQAVDERLIQLLRLLGPAALAADPGLALRLLPQLPLLAPLPRANRQLLGQRLRLGDGRASGQGPGAQRVGIANRGGPRDLLPGQLALPQALFELRAFSQSLLYRDRQGQEAPRLRPVVLLLDVSPPVFGPVEALTRLAAHTVAASLLEAQIPVAVVLAGGPTRAQHLVQSADLITLWTSRAIAPANEAESLDRAAQLAQQLNQGPLPTIILLLSHAHFGTDLDPAPKLSNLNALFISYPNQSQKPAFANQCQNHATLPCGTSPSNLNAVLTEIATSGKMQDSRFK